VARIFVSHSSADTQLACRIHAGLVEGGHEAFLDRDLRDGILVGDEWEQRLHERLRWADAVVCVVTAAYIGSPWCSAEIGHAQGRGSRLLPIAAEPGLTHPLLTSVQHITLDGTGAVPEKLTEALRRIDARGGSSWPDDRSPFPGLRPFETDRHRVFFGRSDDVQELAALLRSPAQPAAGVVLLVGPSGCGKSSLVRAGLVPVMADDPGWGTVAPILPGRDPVGGLVRELTSAARRLGLGWSVAQVRGRVEGGDLVELVDEILLAAPLSRRRRLLLVVDQFEELLTQTPPRERARFAELLRAGTAGSVRVVATLRPEFLDELLHDPDLAALPTHTHALRPLRRDALHAVIEAPARLAGIDVDDELVARIVADTDSGDALPLLAYTLAQLADGVTRGGRLLTSRYEQLGGVQGALARQADIALNEAVAAGGRSPEQVIKELLRLVTVDEQGRPTRWRVRYDELPSPVIAELGPFINRRLLGTDTEADAVVVGVAHEAFLTAWDPLAQAITASATALRARRAIELAAREWDEDARRPGRLWERGQLAAAVTDVGARLERQRGSPPQPTEEAKGVARSPRSWWHRDRAVLTDRVELSPLARSFLGASIVRDRFRRSRATVVLSTLLIVMLVVASVAIVERNRAELQARGATAGQLLTQAEAVVATDPRTALLLGEAAHRLRPTAETQARLVQLLRATRYRARLVVPSNLVVGALRSMAFAPDGRTLVTAGLDGTVSLWDVTDPAGPRPMSTPSLSADAAIAFSPDGRTLAAAGLDGTVTFWDVTDEAGPRRLGVLSTGHTDLLNTVAFSSDGRTLATASSDKTVMLWDVADPARPRSIGPPLIGHTDTVGAVAFAPDGRTLASASGDGTVILWDLTDPARPRPRGAPLTGHTYAVWSVAFAPDGRTLATGGVDKTVTLWDVTDPARPRSLGTPLTDHTGPVLSVAFAPDGRTLATAGDDKSVILRDVTDPARPRRVGAPLEGHFGPVTSMVFAPDGRTLATGSDDSTVILWDLTDPGQPRPGTPRLESDDGPLDSVAFAPAGHTVATGAYGGEVMLWDVADPARPRSLGAPFEGHFGPVHAVAFAPDGDTLAAAGDDKTVILWDVTDPARPRRLGAPLTGHTDAVSSVAFAPRGHTLATGSSDTTVILWDVTDPALPRRLGNPLTGHAVGATELAFAPDGRTLAATGPNRSVILWDVTDLARPRRLGEPLTGHTGFVWSLAFAPDGQTLATGGTDKNAILWDVTDPARPRRLGAPLTGQTDTVQSVAFAPDGKTLATVSTDGTAILWDVTDLAQPRRLGAPLTGHTGPVWSVAFDPDGHTLATASNDHTVILWDLTGLIALRDHALERACGITGGMTVDDWTRLVPGLPYENPCPG
jgi:WD40 repeat protein